MTSIFSKILGTGSYLPEKVLTNDDLSKMVDTSDEWVTTRTGIKSRHISEPSETPASMAEIASRRAIEAAQIDVKDIDLLIVTSVAPEKFFPSTSCMLHGRLEASPTCMSFDVSATCSGFVYALTIADQFIRSGRVKSALLVASEMMTRFVDWKDRSTCVLFGDAAAAVVLGPDTAPGVLATETGSSGQEAMLLYRDSGLYRDQDTVIHMNGRELYKYAVETMRSSMVSILEKANLTMDNIDWIIPHQANARIIDAAIDRLHFPKERVLMTIEEHANTSSATIPLALDTAVRDGRIQPGQTLLLDAFGGGLTWGSAIVKY